MKFKSNYKKSVNKVLLNFALALKCDNPNLTMSLLKFY